MFGAIINYYPERPETHNVHHIIRATNGNMNWGNFGPVSRHGVVTVPVLVGTALIVLI